MSPLAVDARRALTAYAGQPDLRAQFLETLERYGDAALRRDTGPAHLTASTLVLDEARTRVLLVLHVKTGLWLQPGGHCEPGDTTLAEAARREATEETGLTGLRMSDAPVDLDRHPAPCRPGVVEHHFDVRFCALAPAGAQPARSEELVDLRWFPVDALPQPSPPDLPRLVASAARISRTDSGPGWGRRGPR